MENWSITVLEECLYMKDALINDYITAYEKQTEEIQKLKDAVEVLLDIVKECYPNLSIINFEKLIQESEDI